MSEWIKCSERMPPKGISVLTYEQDEGYKIDGYIICVEDSDSIHPNEVDERGRVWTDGGGWISHWMTLPLRPE